jgi:hypothetical protein
MTQPSWVTLGALVAINLLALYLGITTTVGPEGSDPRPNMFRRIARNTGLIIGIGGWVPAILMLMDLLNGHQ